MKDKIYATQFDNFQDYFRYRLQREIVSSDGSKKSNLETLAKTLGYNSASSLSMILTGERLPSSEFIEAISDHWNLKEEERHYLRSIVQLEKLSKKGKATNQVLERLNEFEKANRTHKLSLKQFSLMRDWYHLVIQSMVSCFDFREDHNWISRRLRKKVSPSQVKKALGILLDLNIIQRNAQGNLEAVVRQIETTHEIASEAIREHHKGMMSRAIEAVDEQDVSARHFNSLTLKFDTKDMPEAKKSIVDFVNEFNSEFRSEDSNQIFQLNLQLFEHTKTDKKSESPSNASN